MLVLVGSLATLFGLGVVIGTHRSRGWLWSLGVGVAIIAIEAAAAHRAPLPAAPVPNS